MRRNRVRQVQDSKYGVRKIMLENVKIVYITQSQALDAIKDKRENPYIYDIERKKRIDRMNDEYYNDLIDACTFNYEECEK